ncbi:MAG: ABC transporter ATP-binding protein [Candidatus Bipolaricaulia bacterium]
MAEAEVVFKNVTKIFSEGTDRAVYAVDHVSMEVEQGLLVTLLGPSGCGKTTSLRIIAGFEYPTSGDVYLRGRRINDVPPQKRDTAMVFQSYGLFPHMTVLQNVAYGLKVKRVPRQQIKNRVAEALSLVGLQGLEDRSTGQLSGGQQQRVALCRALVTEPKVLLFDEPLSNLDAKLRKGTREQIRNLQQELGITSVYVTHDQAEAMSISDKIVVMNEGRIEQIGVPGEIYEHPRSRFVADFIGEANFHTGRVVAIQGQQITVDLFGKPITVEQEQDGDFQFQTGDEVEAVVRPEAIDLVAVDAGDVNGKIDFCHYTGSIASYELKLENGEEMEVEVANPQERGLLTEGARVGINLHKHSIHLLKTQEDASPG